MVNLDQKTAFFGSLNQVAKKNTTKILKNELKTTKVSKILAKKKSRNHFGFAKTDQFSNYQLKCSFSDLHYRVKKSLAISLTDSKDVNISLRS